MRNALNRSLTRINGSGRCGYHYQTIKPRLYLELGETCGANATLHITFDSRELRLLVIQGLNSIVGLTDFTLVTGSFVLLSFLFFRAVVGKLEYFLI